MTVISKSSYGCAHARYVMLRISKNDLKNVSVSVMILLSTAVTTIKATTSFHETMHNKIYAFMALSYYYLRNEYEMV